MRHITPTTLILAALALPFAGCGSDDSNSESASNNGNQAAVAGETPNTTTTGTPDSSTGGKLGADAFIGCFELDGYEAGFPEKNQESVFAGIARSDGFKVFPVNVTSESSKAIGVADVYIVFFEDAEKAAEAGKDAKTSDGEPAVVRGPAVLAYADPDTRGEIEPAVDACLK